MTIRELLEKRSKLIADMRSLTETPAGEGGDLSDEQNKKFDSMKAELEGVEKRIEQQRFIDEAERRMNGNTLAGSGDGQFDSLCGGFSLQRAIAAQIEPRSVDAGREFEVSRELARRSGRTPQGILVPLNAVVENRAQTVAGQVGNLVQTDVLASQFIDALRPATVLGSLGARVLTGLRGDIAIPKMDGLQPAAEWLETEGTSALTGGDHAFKQITGAPKIVGLMTTWSRKTMLQANPAIEQLVRADFTAKLAAAIDLAGLSGTGTAGQPLGILNTPGIASETLTGGEVSWRNLLNMIATVLGADIRGGSFGFALNAFVQAYLRGTLREEGDAVAGYLMDTPSALAGYQVQVTSQIAGGKLLFGDFSQVIMAFWGDSGADILVNPYADSAYAKGNVLIRAFVDADVLIRHTEGFVKAEGINL